MTDDGQEAAGDHEIDLIGRGSDAGLGGKLPQVDTEHPLSDVTDENQQAADGTEDTVGIGRPRIMTAVLAGIGMVQDLADDQAAGDRAYQIGQDQAEDTGHHKRSPSFLPRKMSRMGVPSKPKVFAQSVFQEAQIRKMHELGLIDEENKRRRLDRSLGHVVDFQQPSAFGRRRIGELGIFDEFV